MTARMAALAGVNRLEWLQRRAEVAARDGNIDRLNHTLEMIEHEYGLHTAETTELYIETIYDIEQLKGNTK